LNECEALRESERVVSVEVHPVLLLRGESSRTHSLRGGPDAFSGGVATSTATEDGVDLSPVEGHEQVVALLHRPAALPAEAARPPGRTKGGYGLRASRALLALLVTVALFAVCFWLFGFKTQPRAQPPGLTGSLLFSIESTTSLLRGQRLDLTEPGRALQIVLRLLGPLFFGLALLSLRGRVKR
jgi:hypothetical protein